MTLRHHKESKMVASFEAKLHKHFGNTLLHITDDGLILASSERGTIFDLDWDQIYTVTLQKHKIMLTWKSTSSIMFTYAMTFDDPDLVMHEIKKINEKLSKKITFLDMLRKIHANEITKLAKKIRTNFGDNKDRWHTTKTPKIFHTLLDSSITPIIASRHPSVPENIPDEYVWNDAWYDASRECFFTHNNLFKKITDFHKRSEQIKHKSSSSSDSISLDGLPIKFVFGYPATLLSWDGDGGHVDAWTLLPTMRIEMLTAELVYAKIQTDPSAHRLNYSTDSLVMFSPKFHSSISVYETAFYNDNMRRHIITTYPQIISQLNYLRENIPIPTDSHIDVPYSSQQDDGRRAHDDPNFSKWMHQVDKRDSS